MQLIVVRVLLHLYKVLELSLARNLAIDFGIDSFYFASFNSGLFNSPFMLLHQFVKHLEVNFSELTEKLGETFSSFFSLLLRLINDFSID